MLLLGIDLGSSMVKCSVTDGERGKRVSSAYSPKTGMKISAPQPGLAEQDPEVWWENIILAVRECIAPLGDRKSEIGAIGIAYQMHGLVAVDKNGRVLRPAIMWCDSRAVETGQKAFEKLGKDFCLHHLLNSPANFTASRLAWVRENEPSLYHNIYKIMLPGDYIAMRLTGRINTTLPGLSEGIFWDYIRKEISSELLEYFNISSGLLADTVDTFSIQGQLTAAAAEELGLTRGIPVSYRAGDQPNNAMALNVLQPDEVAAAAGTSGVLYAVTDKVVFDPLTRLNTFMHVNHSDPVIRLGVLLCINGAGILYSWLRDNGGAGLTYQEMNEIAATVDPGSDGLTIIPYGNGAERMLNNYNTGASVHHLNYNIHHRGHLFRAAQEAIAYSFRFGLEIMKETGITPTVIRAGESNLFLSPLFREILSSLTSTAINLYNSDGADGAARGAGLGCGFYKSWQEAFSGLEVTAESEPDRELSMLYDVKYMEWLDMLQDNLPIQ